ncbi:hypothetical protein ACS0TY_029407 [Phlomoides rotata]
MLRVGDIEEAFFDTAEQFTPETSDYDIWLKEPPQSVGERRDNFLSTLMGYPTSVLCDVDNLLLERRNSNSEANCSADYSDELEREVDETMQVEEAEGCSRDRPRSVNKKRSQVMRWLRSFAKKTHSLDKSNPGPMHPRHKRYMECSAVYGEQQVKAHNGLIWAMKFSPDGRYLASGGEDGVVCIRRVTMVDANKSTYEKSKFVVIPEKIFHLEEEEVQRFKGHSSDVLDLAWSTSNQLLSTSMDKTVRLWDVESDECVGVFHHSNYVTCVQFNPVDERYFISGSIDGNVRVWGIRSGRVEEWANVGDDIVTAVCYQPNGKGFVVGTLSGNCRFYESSGDELLQNAEINIQAKRKSSSNKITGIQFVNNESRRLMITSEDSKIRILDGLEVVCKYKGLTKSGSQMCASFTSSGRHIVSIGEDSHIYLWNYDDDDTCIQTRVFHAKSKSKSIRSCENFISQGASVVLPWLDLSNNHHGWSCRRNLASSRKWKSERFSIANWFSMDRDRDRATSMTWPEEKLPYNSHFHQDDNDDDDGCCSTTWGLVFVTANYDGTIRTFHNYGLPVRV